jgi:hypothetical protein
LQNVKDVFLDNIDAYSIEEFDVLISLFDGGEYLGFYVGSHGINKDKILFTTVGFVQRWYNLTPPDNLNQNNDFEILKVSPEIANKDCYLLAIYYDKEHPERNDMFLELPEEVNLVSSLDKYTDDYLLDKDRLNKFLKAMDIDKIPDKNDPDLLTRRCTGMKILVNQIETNGEKFNELLDDDFRKGFLEFLLKECSIPDVEKESLKSEL